MTAAEDYPTKSALATRLRAWHISDRDKSLAAPGCAIPLSGQERIVLNLLVNRALRSTHPKLRTPEIVDALYSMSNRTPDTCSKVVHVVIHRIRTKLAPLGVGITKPLGANPEGYALYLLDEPAPPQ